MKQTQAYNPGWWQKEERVESKYPRPLALSSSRQLLGWPLLQSVAGASAFCGGLPGRQARSFIGVF